MNDIERLKFNLLESKFPYFSDDDLQNLLEVNNGDVRKASKEGCLIKAQDDGIKLSGMEIPNNVNLFLRRAKQFRNQGSGMIITNRADV